MTRAEKLIALQRALTAKGVRNFRADEFFVKGGAHYNRRSAAYGLNTDPPDNLLQAIVPTAVILQEARSRLGRAIVLTSVYRSPAYNRAIGGASQSYHKKFVAADCIATDIRELYRTFAAMREEGVFSGGLGGYTSFVHVDSRGYNATWGISY